MLAMEARVGPTTQDGTGHLMAVSCPLFEGTMATCHPSGIAGEVVETLRPNWAFHGGDGHHLEDVMANCHPPWYCWKGDWQDHSTPRGSFSAPLEAGEESHRSATSAVCS